MDDSQHVGDLVEFFKVLGEPNRLRIVGLLAERAYTVEQLAVTLGVSASTVSHHLARLARAGLVTARSESYYNLYSLKADALSGMAKELLAQTQPARPASEQGLSDFDRKVLATFTTSDGRIKAFPMQERKFRVLLRHVLPAFNHGVRYTEKRVNEILSKYNDDTARLRRWLVDFGYMAREGGGGKYWRIDEK
ncbi:MAG: metalloregulator ArsR/SmtB family transcription factor [Polyangia bacterium]|jgi:biotin operon repressor